MVRPSSTSAMPRQWQPPTSRMARSSCSSGTPSRTAFSLKSPMGAPKIEETYAKIFKDRLPEHRSRNTVELARFLSPNLLLIHGRFAMNRDQGDTRPVHPDPCPRGRPVEGRLHAVGGTAQEEPLSRWTDEPTTAQYESAEMTSPPARVANA